MSNRPPTELEVFEVVNHDAVAHAIEDEIFVTSTADEYIGTAIIAQLETHRVAIEASLALATEMYGNEYEQDALSNKGEAFFHGSIAAFVVLDRIAEQKNIDCLQYRAQWLRHPLVHRAQSRAQLAPNSDERLSAVTNHIKTTGLIHAQYEKLINMIADELASDTTEHTAITDGFAFTLITAQFALGSIILSRAALEADEIIDKQDDALPEFLRQEDITGQFQMVQDLFERTVDRLGFNADTMTSEQAEMVMSEVIIAADEILTVEAEDEIELCGPAFITRCSADDTTFDGNHDMVLEKMDNPRRLKGKIRGYTIGSTSKRARDLNAESVEQMKLTQAVTVVLGDVQTIYGDDKESLAGEIVLVGFGQPRALFRKT